MNQPYEQTSWSPGRYELGSEFVLTVNHGNVYSPIHSVKEARPRRRKSIWLDLELRKRDNRNRSAAELPCCTRAQHILVPAFTVSIQNILQPIPALDLKK